MTVILEPARLRAPRDEFEATFVLDDNGLRGLFPPGLPRALGYISRGGTLHAPELAAVHGHGDYSDLQHPQADGH